MYVRLLKVELILKQGLLSMMVMMLGIKSSQLSPATRYASKIFKLFFATKNIHKFMKISLRFSKKIFQFNYGISNDNTFWTECANMRKLIPQVLKKDLWNQIYSIS